MWMGSGNLERNTAKRGEDGADVTKKIVVGVGVGVEGGLGHFWK